MAGGVGSATALARSARSGSIGLAAVLVVGLAIRAVAIPLWHGEDFTVWDLASTATLRGSNIYAHHPAYPGGPYAYFPLFLDLELPFQWLAQHTAVPFLIWGKLPIVAADVAVAVLLHRGVRRLGGTYGQATRAAALYFLDPLVIYNSALYGRFDALGCALLLAWLVHAATGRGGTSRAAALYGLAVVAKTFPLFLLATAWRLLDRLGRRRLVLATATVAVVVSVPYLRTPLPYLRDLGYDTGKTAGGMSAWNLLHLVTGLVGSTVISTAGLVIFAVGSLALARRLARADIVLCTALTLVLFLLTNKVVLEQYLTWAMPPLILLCVRPPGPVTRASRAMLAFLTVVGLADTESFHPFGRTSVLVGIVLALGCAAYLVRVTRTDGDGPGRSGGLGDTAPHDPHHGRLLGDRGARGARAELRRARGRRRPARRTGVGMR